MINDLDYKGFECPVSKNEYRIEQKNNIVEYYSRIEQKNSIIINPKMGGGSI